MNGNQTTLDPAYTLRYLAKLQDRLAYAHEAEGKDSTEIRKRATELRARVNQQTLA